MIKKTFNKIKKFSNIKIRFDLPKSKEILLFDEIGALVLTEIIKKDFSILRIPREIKLYQNELEINFWIFLKQVIIFDFKFITYCQNYIKFTSPKVVITFNDNYVHFYKLKEKLKNIHFISIQNGVRLQSWFKSKELIESKNLECDHMFVFNKYILKKYKKYIKTNYHILGGFKNNMVQVNDTKIFNEFLFISQFHKNNKKNQNYQTKVLNLIKKYLSGSNKKLHILLRNKNSFYQKDEIEYFKKIFQSKCVFHKTSKWEKSYKIMDRFENIIFMFSTLGYEAISRKKKVAIFSPSKFQNYKNYFGWPARIQKDYSFFSIKKLTYNETERVLNNIYNCNQLNWDKKYYNVIKDQLLFNKDNIKLKTVIFNLL